MLSGSTPSARPDRLEIAFQLHEAKALQAQGQSQRRVATDLGVAPSTLRDRLARPTLTAAPGALPAATTAFLESPEGTLWLHRVMVALLLVFTVCGPCGLGLVQTFLRLTGLDAFLASSHGSLHKLVSSLHEHTAAFARQQHASLGAAMPPRSILAAADEVYFAPAIVLVGQDPVSGYLLLEKLVDTLDEATWTQAWKHALHTLPVRVDRVVSDQGSSLVASIVHGLDAAQGPDVFHLQYRVSRVSAAALGGDVRAAQQAVDKARSQGLSTDALQKQLLLAEGHQKAMREAIGALSEVYHPFDLQTGARQRPAEVEAKMHQALDRCEGVGQGACLPKVAKAVKKVRACLPQVAEMVRRFDAEVGQTMLALQLPEPLRVAVLEGLLPAVYLQHVAAKTADGEARKRLEDQAAALARPLEEERGALLLLSGAGAEDLVERCRALAERFVRASSCVEGRNGQLSLHHHGAHQLSQAKLGAMTAVHNFLIRRPDGTTAAERFFGRGHADLFESLVDTMPLPARPAARRPALTHKALLN